MRDEQEALRRKLDEVVGTGFDERGEPFRPRWFRASLPRWIAGIVAGIAMAALVWWVLDSHLKAAHHRSPDPQSPVIIDIVPGK